MHKKILPVLACTFSLTVYAQQDTLDQKTLSEVVISANKFEEKKKNVNQRIDVITAQQITKANAQNTGDLLSGTGQVFVQKSQQGGSSPVLRGFEASRVLLVIDGIRMNNAIYRAGHLQNVITVDPNMLERVEVLYGPGSTLYGSDALGGVVHLRTKSPRLSLNGKVTSTGSVFARGSSANNEKTVHGDVSIGGGRFAWLQSYTYSYFGDMRMGDHYTDKYTDFGRRSRYITSVNGIDSVVTSKDDRIQKFSGYQQWDITQKILFKQNDRITHSLNLQHSNSTNIPRYDRLQDLRNFGGSIGTTLRFAEWFYGPQTRYLGAYELNWKPASAFDIVRLNIHYQDIEESRQQREYRRYDRFDSRREKLRIWGFTLDSRKKWKTDELTVGFDGQFNDLKSVADRTNLNTGTKTKLDTRYPDGNNSMNYLGLFGQHLKKFKDGKLILNDGLRLQLVNLRSTIVDNSFFNLPVTDIEQNTFALTGNLGLVYLPSNTFRVAGGISTGFRNPNIDDLARIFESSSALQRVVVPKSNIKAEYTYTADLSISQIVAEKVRIEVNGFYTWFRNAIGLAPYQLNGQDSILYNGVLSAVFANRNVKKANSYGYNIQLGVDFSRHLSWAGTITYTYGRFKNEQGDKIPQDHIPPVYGRTNLTYNEGRISTEFFVLFNGWKKAQDYNPDGEDNQQYATPEGMPSWVTLNWRGQVNITRHFLLQMAVENLTDRNYRYFASGFSAPGRNFVLAIRYSW